MEPPMTIELLHQDDAQVIALSERIWKRHLAGKRNIFIFCVLGTITATLLNTLPANLRQEMLNHFITLLRQKTEILDG